MPTPSDHFDVITNDGVQIDDVEVAQIARLHHEGRLGLRSPVRVHNTRRWVTFQQWFEAAPAPPVDINDRFTKACTDAYPEFQSAGQQIQHLISTLWDRLKKLVGVMFKQPFLHQRVAVVCAIILLPVAYGFHFYNARQETRHYDTYVRPLYQISDAIDRRNYREAVLNQKYYSDKHQDWLDKHKLDGHMSLCNALLVTAAIDQNSGLPDASYHALRARTLLHEAISQARHARD